MNYDTEITLNPIFQNSDFEITPINNDINLNLELTDFDIGVSIGGNPGEAATVEVGIVTTVDHTVPATVSNSGTPYHAVLDFGIPHGRDCYVYIAYASSNTGTDFTNTFNQSLDYIAILESHEEILSPIVTDFTGLWKNYKGIQGDPSFPTTIITETPTGLVNGSNTGYTLSNTPISQDAIFFLVNGIKRDVTLVGNVCTLGFAPTTGSVIRVTYFKYIDVLAITVSDIMDFQAPKVTISLSKSGANGFINPKIFKWPQPIQVSSVELMSNCSEITVSIDGVEYNETTLIGITLTGEMQIVDLTIVAGQYNADALIIF